LRILAEEGGEPPVVGPDILLPEVAHLKFDHLAMSLAAYTASTETGGDDTPSSLSLASRPVRRGRNA
jgi:hypothetical protein